MTVRVEYRCGDAPVQPADSCLFVEHGEFESLSVDGLFEESGPWSGSWLEFNLSRCSCSGPVVIYLHHPQRQVSAAGACVITAVSCSAA